MTYDFSKYLFRASGVAHIMTGATGLSEAQLKLIDDLEARKVTKKGLTDKQDALYMSLLNSDKELTDKQNETLNDLSKKKDEVIGITEKQQETLDDLIYKRDNKQLSTGAKSYLKRLYREVVYNRRKELVSKYINKGNTNEEDSITILSILDDTVYENNKERLYNDWLTGECDIKPVNKKGIDIKSSWDLSTFPFEDEPLDPIYDYQNLSYIDLYGADEWETAYVLTNLSDSMLMDQIYREGFNHENNEVPAWKKLEIINRFIYDEENFFRLIKLHDCIEDTPDERSADIINGFVEIPLEKRVIKKLTVRDDEKINLIHEMCELSREFLMELAKK